MWLNAICLLLIGFAVCVSRNEALNLIALYAAIPMSFIGSFVYNGNSLKTNKYLQMFLLLYLWIFITILTAQNIDAASKHISPMLGCILLCFIVSNLAQSNKLIPWIYVVYFLLLVEAVIYVQNNILVLYYDISSARADDDKINANTLAYYLFYATFSIFFLRDIVEKKKIKKILALMFLAMIPLSFYIAIIAASRQILVIQIPTFILLIWTRYLKGAKISTKIYTAIFAIIAIVLFYNSVSNTYENSYLNSRNEEKYTEDIRVVLIKEAFELGCNNPIFGVGPGGFARQQSQHLFSHCTYTELFANSGFTALAIYVHILIYFMNRQFKRYKRYKDSTYLVFFSFGLIYTIYQFFFVFTSDLWLISFFVFVATHSENYYSQKHKLSVPNRKIPLRTSIWEK